jgi:hypothetical protein
VTGGARRKPALTGLALAASLMPEVGARSLQGYVLKLLKDLQRLSPSIRWQHNSDSRRAHAGWVDWTIGGPGGVLFWELKQEGENPTPAQADWLALLQAAGCSAAVRRPSDLLSGLIQAELEAVAGIRSTRGNIGLTRSNGTVTGRPGVSARPRHAGRVIVGIRPVAGDHTKGAQSAVNAESPGGDRGLSDNFTSSGSASPARLSGPDTSDQRNKLR